MAELLECLICGYQTVRCGMTNHLSTKHPKEYVKSLENFRASVRDTRIEEHPITKIFRSSSSLE
jgi:hypothetical protein